MPPRSKTTVSEPDTTPVKTTTTRSVADKLKIKAAKAWTPEAGTVLTGTVVTLTKRTSDYGEHIVVILKPADSDDYVAVHAFHQVLIDQLKEVREEVGKLNGAEITLRYDGKVASRKRKDDEGNPQKYHSYTVVSNSDVEVEEIDLDDVGDVAPY